MVFDSTLLKWLYVKDLDVERPRFCPKNVPYLEFWKIKKYTIFGKNQAQLCSKFQYHIEWKYIKDQK